MKTTKTRRSFIADVMKYSCAPTALSLPITSLLSPSTAYAQNSDDFRALVYIFLVGGNDSFNMLVPQGEGALRDRYDTGRKNIALNPESLNELRVSTPAKIYGGETYKAFGMHPQFTELSAMFNDGELAVLCNLGNLMEPTTRQSFLDKSVALPPQLFSHSDQQRQFQSEPTTQFESGWGGRVSEMLLSQNTDINVSPLISVSGLNPFQVSQSPYLDTFVMSNQGLVKLRGFNKHRSNMVDAYMYEYQEHLMAQKYQDIYISAKEARDVIVDAFSIANDSGVDYDSIFSAHNANGTDLGKQLKTVAKMIAGRSTYGNKRPIFFVKINGFDTHKNILSEQNTLLKQVNDGLRAFRDVLVQQGDFNKVLSFVGSEFARTFTPNSDGSSAGTDHAWGGNALVMGGMVKGASFYGTYPDLKIGGELDADKNKARGRWIPTSSTSQCSAVIAHWMGVPRENLNQVFPSIDNFIDPFSPEANLGFIREEVLS